MCIRRVWGANPIDMDIALYRKIARENFHGLKKLHLYGLGEPLINPYFLEMVRIARENLPSEGIISFTTNGSLLNSNLADKLLKIGVDSISFSIDTLNIAKLRHIRSGSQPKIIIRNFKHIARVKRRLNHRFKLGVETVLMRENYEDLPKLIEKAAEEDVDYILVSHVVPYTKSVFKSSTYVTMSSFPLNIIRQVSLPERKLMLNPSYDFLSRLYGRNAGSETLKKFINLWRRVDERGYWINPPLFFAFEDKINLIDEEKKIFYESRKVAGKYGITLKLPNIYPDARNRHCPYVDKNAAVVRSDGKVTSCLEFTYTHPMYVNMHLKNMREVVFGDLTKEKLEDIWSREKYVDFRETRRNFVENIPWCGDCIYSTQKCFFTKTNEGDCYGNEPGCSECLYSVDLAQCNI